MEEHDTPSHQALCRTCMTNFNAFIPDRANGCACTIQMDGQISLHYGSTFYGKCKGLRFVSAHSLIEAGPIRPGVICDNCLMEHVLEARIEPIT